MIELEGVTHRYGEGQPPALDGVSLVIGAGERVALLGPSGAGKSTLLRSIAGLVRPTHGVVRFRGRPVTGASPGELREIRKEIAVIFQEYHLIEPYTALGNVLVGRFGHLPLWRVLLGLFPRADRELARRALAELGLADYAQVPVRRLSGGQRQRVAVARALVQGGAVILGDEPVSNLDPATARMVLELLCERNRREGTTLVLSLHTPELALQFFDRIVVLRAGRVVMDRPAREVTPGDLAAAYGVRTPGAPPGQGGGAGIAGAL